MNCLHKLRVRIRALFQKEKLDARMDDEMRSHIEMQTQENIEAGMKPDEARYAALRQFGWVESIKDTCREQRGVSWIENLGRDIRYGARMLCKNPGFTVVAVFTLALGIGATAAMFSVVNAVLLRPLSYAEPDRLVRIYSEFPGFPNGGLRRFSLSSPEYLDLKREAKSWESLDAWATGDVNVGTDTQPLRARAAAVTGGLFHSLGVNPILGRVITPEDDASGGPRVAAISQDLWQRIFAGNLGILGRDLLLEGNKHTIVGVMPKNFEFPPGEINPAEIWVPLQIDPSNPGARSDHGLNLLGRLRTGVTFAQGQAELQSLVKRWGETGSGHRFDPTDHTIVSFGLHDEVVRGARPALRMLLGAVAFLLLIACVNVANLLLARAESRQREITIRAALGAGLRRLTIQFVIEGVLLSFAGAAAGLLLAYGGLGLIKSASAASLPRAAEIGIDLRVVFFAMTLSIVTGVIFGLTPLAHVLKHNLHNALKTAAASTTGTAGIQHFRQVLVAGELALALTLFIGTGLMIRAFWNLQEVNTGFDSNHVVTMSVSLPNSTYNEPQVRDFWTRLEARLGALSGVESAALASGLPPIYPSTHTDTKIEGFVPTQGGPIENVQFYQSVSQGYFKALRIPLLDGRYFDERDGPEAAEVAIVNQSMARTFWGNERAVGRRIRPNGTTNWCTVIGVIADAKNDGLEKPSGTELYLPFTQNAGRARAQRMHIVVRSPINPSTIVSAVRSEVAALDPGLPLAGIRTLDELISAAQSRPRFLTLLLMLFAFVALVLASVGIYGVISYAVARQTKEFGLRMALGAQRGDVLAIVLGRGMLLSLVGIGIGLIGAFTLTRFLSSLLFGVTPTDPATFFSVSLLLGVVAFLASYIPARRATKVDPMVALRYE